MKGAQILELLATVAVLLMRFPYVMTAQLVGVAIFGCRSPYEILLSPKA